MIEDACKSHEWGEAELVESLLLGRELMSPLCRHCGAVKLEEDLRASDRHRAALAERPINRPESQWSTDAPRSAPGAGRPASAVASNVPPPSVRVHTFQQEFFPDV
jgi:hypothetical protein